MNNTPTLIPSNQVIIATKGNHITAGDISRALFYANSRLLAMRLHVDKSFATAIPGYADAFYSLMKWEMETFVMPFINISFVTWLSAVIPQLFKDVLVIVTAHTLVDRRPDVNVILQDIKALHLSVDSNKWDDYDIAHMPDYFNDWWKESLACCRVSDMVPKSSIQDVMDLVEWHFSQLPDRVRTGLLPYMLKGPDALPDTSLVQCHQTPISREFLGILQGRMMNFKSASDRLARLVGPIDEITRAVTSSQALIDRLNTDDNHVNVKPFSPIAMWPDMIQQRCFPITQLFLQDIVAIPLDWALYQTYLAGELVQEIFMSTLLQRLVKDMDLGLLDIDTCIALEQLANVMATAYSNAVHLEIDMVRYNDALDKDESGQSGKQEEILFNRFPPDKERFLVTPSVVMDAGGRIIVWYLPGVLTAMIMKDMHGATHSMSGLLKHSITTAKTAQWRTHRSHFHPSPDGMITPGCINISPAWFQQGREKHGFPNLDPEDGFSPEVSTALKGDAGRNITTSLQRSGIIVSAALRVMHPDLYWAGMATQVRLGEWAAKYELDEMSHLLQ